VIGYLIELIIKIWQFGFIFLQNLVSLGHFFSLKNPLYRSKSYFSGRNLASKRNPAARAYSKLYKYPGFATVNLQPPKKKAEKMPENPK